MSTSGAPSNFGAVLRGEWPLDPAVTYLNHGGYGVTPHAVLAEQADWRARIERNPSGFMTREYSAALRHAAAELASFVGARPEDCAFVENATTGCNAVLRSLDFRPGDEILTTDLAYGAVRKAIRYAAQRGGATVVEVEIPLPLPDMAALVDAVAARLGPRTRLAVFDHVASHSALVLPVAELARRAHAVGARVLIDGAHVPGLLPLDVTATGADWYVGNCHKWLMAPRSCGFLWATPEVQELVHPLSISHGYGTSFAAEFEWTGTRDPTPFFSVPAAIAFHRRLGGRLLMTRNTWLAREAARLLADAWGAVPSGPAASGAAMAALRLPLAAAATPDHAAAVQRGLAEDHKIEVAAFAHRGALWLRIAAQAYNELADYDRLARVFPVTRSEAKG